VPGDSAGGVRRRAIGARFSFQHRNRLLFRDTDSEGAVETATGQVLVGAFFSVSYILLVFMRKACTFRIHYKIW
jgi:hypothetical protein